MTAANVRGRGREFVVTLSPCHPVTLSLLLAAGCMNGPSGVRPTPAAGLKAGPEQAIAAVKSRGGDVKVDTAGEGKPVVSADLHRMRDAGAVLVSLGPLTKARALNLYDTGFTDADLERLRGLPELETLNLSATQVTDAGLPLLQGLPKLRVLRLNNTAVSDAGLQALRGLTELRELSLVNTRVTDEGLAYLGGLKHLEKLALGGPAVTDRGLASLRGLPQLRDLDLFGTRVTEAGVGQLKAALPQLRVLR
jgi:Leucine-rich repeat (LRR) protein